MLSFHHIDLIRILVTWFWRGRGVQVNWAQRLQGYIYVVDMVKDQRLLLQGLVEGRSRGRLIPPRGLPPQSGGSNQLVVAWWSSTSSALKRETIWNNKHCTWFGLRQSCLFFVLFVTQDFQNDGGKRENNIWGTKIKQGDRNLLRTKNVFGGCNTKILTK